MLQTCPNCGAPGGSSYCEYCGTPLYSPNDALERLYGKLAHVWFEDDGQVHCFDIFVETIDQDNDYTTLYGDGSPYMSILTRSSATFGGSLLEADREYWAKEFMRKGLLSPNEARTLMKGLDSG